MSDKLNKSLSQIFDVTPIDITNSDIEEKEAIAPLIEKEPNRIETLDVDLVGAYEKSKENLEDVITQGKDAMDTMLTIAKESQHPRAFEVFGGIMEKIIHANKELMALQKNIREITEHKSPTTNNIDQAIFVGSTTDVLKLLKGEKSDEA